MRMRKKRHGSERLASLGALIYPFEKEKWTPAAEVFTLTPNSPLYLEVGCGKGEFISQASLRYPERNFIALEKISDVAVCAVEKYARSRGLGGLAPNGGWLTPSGELYKNGDTWNIPEELRGNVRFIAEEALEVVSAMPESILTGIIANFSDPWSRKCNYEKRRLTHPAFLENYKRVLVPGGVFAFKTDNDTLFDYTAEMLTGCGFEITYLTRDLHSSDRAEDNIITEYERNFSEQGIAIKMLEAKAVK